MSNTPRSQRSPTKFEAEHNFFQLRDQVTELILLDFGFSEEKYQKQIDKYRRSHQSSENVDAVVERYEKKCNSFSKQFVDYESQIVLDLLRQISVEFFTANSIYPSPKSPAKIMEYCQRRKHLLDRGVLAYTDIENCYKSWMGTYAKHLSKYQRQHIQDLYKSLFERSPRWKKEQK